MPESFQRGRLSSRDQTSSPLGGGRLSLSGLDSVSRLGLPNELLELVFLFWRTIDQPNAELGSRGWLSVLLVCKTWMTIAKRCSPLWSIIPGSRLTPRLILQMLEFSKTASLSLTLDCSKHASADLPMRRILDKRTVTRLHHLDITLSDHNPDALLALQQANAAESLRTLTINSDRVILVLSPTLFTSSLPQLEALTLSGCIVPWDATAFFKHLVCLSIHLPPDANGLSGGTIDEHSAAFRHAMTALRGVGSTLRSLTLRNFIPILPLRDEHKSRSHVDLPCLMDLVLEGVPLHCTTFMSCLSFPLDTNITVFFDCDSPTALLDAINDMDLPSLRPTTLEIDFDPVEHVELGLRLHFPQTPGIPRAHTRTLYVNPTSTGYRWTSFNQYADAVYALRLDTVRTLVHRASLARTWPARIWHVLLGDGRAPRLRNVLAAGVPGTLSLLDALAPLEDTTPPLAPRLRHLGVAPLEPVCVHLAQRPEVLDFANFLQMRTRAGCAALCITTIGVVGREAQWG